jgi:hypothetical protein
VTCAQSKVTIGRFFLQTILDHMVEENHDLYLFIPNVRTLTAVY